MKKGRSKDRIAQVKAEVDAYTLTIQAMLALEKIFGETLRAQVRQGPSMLTSTGNKVTPDMTFEVAEGRFAGYRAVNEIKSQYPPYGRPVHRLAVQLQQYDDITSGWSLPADAGKSGWPSYDLMLTVPTDHANDYVVNLHRDICACGVVITKKICILGFGRDSHSSDDRLRTKIVYGHLSVPELNRRLAEDDERETYEFLDELGAVRFYDSNPPVTYMMSILWSHIFLNMIHSKKRRVMLQGRAVNITVEVKRIHKLVSRFAPPSNLQCIKMSWVTTALDKFVDIKLATKVDNGKYVISYKYKPLVLDWLIRLVNNTNGGTRRRADGNPNASLDGFTSG